MQSLPPGQGWFKAVRSDEALELLTHYPNAFRLAYLIAFRARWKTGFNAHQLSPGEALIGDWEETGFTEQEYRTAKDQLAKWHFATFKPTAKGTIARLTDSRVFGVNIEPDNDQINRQVTGSQRTANGQLTTNLEGKKERMKEGGGAPPRKSQRDLEEQKKIIEDQLDKYRADRTDAQNYRDSRGNLLKKHAELKAIYEQQLRTLKEQITGVPMPE